MLANKVDGQVIAFIEKDGISVNVDDIAVFEEWGTDHTRITLKTSGTRVDMKMPYAKFRSVLADVALALAGAEVPRGRE